MLHTLLPHKEKIMLRREYRLRALVVFLFMLDVSILIGIGALTPVFIRATLDEREADRKIVELDKTSDQAEIKDIQKKLEHKLKMLAVLSKPESLTNSDIIEGMVNLRQDISLSSISVTTNSTTSLTIVIEGNAPTRNSLLAFQKRIEKDPTQKTELPISTLTRSVRVPFSMKITKKLQ